MFKFTIPVGWTVYKISSYECFSFGGLSICDTCNKFQPEGGYLVPVLNYFMCSNCYSDWRSRAKFYPEDKDFENQIIWYYEGLLPVIPSSIEL